MAATSAACRELALHADTSFEIAGATQMSGLEPGARIAQRYIVQARLGSGGMATVYECIDSKHGTSVAIKLLHHHLLVDNTEFVARFRREAELMAHLCDPTPHPNLVAVSDVIARPELMAIVMELVPDGLGLDGLLAERGGRLSEPEAVSILRGVLDGLALVHERGIIHRDLKPSNILLARGADGTTLQPKLSDFGIAKWLGREDGLGAGGANLTQTSSTFGSPAYMAPELFDSAAAASVSSDLYALGVVLYELLVGRPPFEVDSMPSHIMRVSTRQAPSVRELRPELSGDIERVVAVALAKDPEDRFVSARQFAEALQGRGLDGLPVAGDPQRFGRDYRVNRRIGRGPSTNVYACTDDSLDVAVGVKMLRGKDAARRERFLEEARAQAALHQGRPHRHVTAIRHIFDEGGTTALIVELVDGLPLDRYVDEARPDLATVLRLFGEAADALKHAHRLGLVHRNLKPTNFLVTWSRTGASTRQRARAKLCDFGMDRVTADSLAARLEAARRSGTLAYLPPELQNPGGRALPGSDIYALGVLLLVALGARVPAEPASGAEGVAELIGAIPDVSLPLRSLLTDMLALVPSARPSAEQVFDQVNAILRNLTGRGLEPVDVVVADEVAAYRPPPSRWPLLVAALVAVGCAAAYGAWWFMEQQGDPGTPTADANTSQSRDESATDVVEPETAPPPVTTPPEPTWTDVTNDVARFLAGRSEDITACLEEAFRHERATEITDPSGTVRVEIEVDADGQVTDVDVLEDTLEIVDMGACVRQRIETWTFPGSGRDETWTKAWFF